MADEVTTTLLGTNGGLVAEVLSDLVFQQLYDPSDLRALSIAVPWTPRGSKTLHITKDAVPGAFATTGTEIASSFVNSGYTTSKFTLSPTRRGRQYQLTDLLPVAGGPVQVERVALKLSQGVSLTFTDSLTTLFTSLSGSVTSGSGVALDVDTLYAAQFALNLSNAPGPYAAVLYNKQMNDFRESLRNEPGAQAFQDATAAMLETKGPGFQGTWNGIEFYQSDSVPTTGGGADSAGAMFAQGCWAHTMPDPRIMQGHIPASNVIFANDMYLLELVRDATNGMSTILGQFYLAVAEAEDARGVQIISDR